MVIGLLTTTHIVPDLLLLILGLGEIESLHKQPMYSYNVFN